MSPGGPALLHAAVVADDPDELVPLCLPVVDAALAVGAPVEVVLDRRGARAFRAARPDAGLQLPSPVDVDAATLGHRLADRETGAVVVGRVCADAAPPDRPFAEDALTVLLADRPLSVVCVYAPAQVEEARRTHPWLLTAGGPVLSPDHTPPATTSPVPAAVLGSSVDRVPVPDGAALAALRHRFAAAVRDAGLDGERAEAAVLAAHEAMLLACGVDLAGRADLPPGDHTLDVRVSAEAVVAECRGVPRDPGGSGMADQDPRFAHLARFCDHATAHDDRHGRTVRVLTGTR
ncbi:hypothetical protein [Actinomycetospora sp. NBRC 106378]|uniref:hypothetical protein n=1 Tax=Actinomycetospora sp. NBRC 106378 TaxID=3032208 RepID=UPI0024A31DBE|nr:hypothetical protein [Actinomycetospora sp. NBRC 106378]GLZ51841.1 hypothetical protein Acsp07_14580 [Actinomycetospora sp. NBRC 106378]